MSDGHFTLDELRACARGDDAGLVDRVVEHCQECRDCGAQLAAMMALMSQSGHQVTGSLATALRSKRTWQVLVPAAAVVVIVALTLPLYRTAMAPTTEQQLVALATSEPIAEMNVRFHLGSGILVTAPGPVIQPKLLTAGLALSERDYEESISLLRELRAEAPRSLTVAAYLGIALYLSGDDSPEVGRLLAMGTQTSVPPVSEYTQWYLGNFLLRTGEVDAATEALRELEALEELPGRLANELLARMATIGR